MAVSFNSNLPTWQINERGERRMTEPDATRDVASPTADMRVSYRHQVSQVGNDGSD